MSISNIFRLIRSIKKIGEFNKPGSIFHRNAENILNRKLQGIDILSIDGVPSNALEKIRWYMAEYRFVCGIYHQIHNIPVTNDLNDTYLLSGIPVTVSDLLVDDTQTANQSHDFILNPRSRSERNDLEKLYRQSFSDLMRRFTDKQKEIILPYWETLMKAQLDSQKQWDHQISASEIDKICFHKCGENFLWLRSMIDHPWRPGEKELLYEMGGFIQFCNDSQDLHKDLSNGLRTFATVRPNPRQIAKDLGKYKNSLFESISKSWMSHMDKVELTFLLNVMYLAIRTKLEIFDELCEGEFSQEKFLSVDKELLRKKVRGSNLLKRSFWEAVSFKPG